MFLTQIKKLLGPSTPAAPRPTSASVARARLLESVRTDRTNSEDSLKPIHDLASTFAAQTETLLNLPNGTIQPRIDHNGGFATVNYKIPLPQPPS